MRTKENTLLSRLVLLVCFIFFGLYYGMLFIEGLYTGGDLSKGVAALIAGSALVVSYLIFYIVYPHEFYLPLYIGTATQIVFIISGVYMRDLEFYFIIMFLLLGMLAVLRNYKLLAALVVINFIVNIIVFIFVVPRLDWLNHYRFFMQFVIFLCGSAFMLVITHYVEKKITQAENAFSSFSSLMRNTPNYMLITDANYKVRYVSAAMLKFLKYPKPDYVVGQPLVDLFQDQSLKLMFTDIVRAEGFFETVVKIDTDGEERHLKIISDKLSDDYGGKFIDISDITPIVKSQLAAEEAQYRAELANLSKSKFLATMSHEIRTPMNAIIGISEIELSRDSVSQEIKGNFSKIYNSGHILLSIINDILDLSKIETGKLELVPILYNTANLLNDTIQLNMMRIGSKPIDFMFRVSEDLPLELFGDDLRIKQILNNLLSNAIKYTSKGVVIFKVSSQAEQGAVKLIFTVSDTGQGMTQEQIAVLFDIYSQFNREANRAIEGTGLGMSITKNLVNLMDGSITVKSDPGIGTIFKVELMQQPAGIEVLGKELADNLQNLRFLNKSPAQILPITREQMPYGRVLVVDDLDTNLFVAKGFMLQYGLTVDTVTNGPDAIDKIRAGAVYDVVFMDHMMPGMDGIKATQIIRQAGYDHPIVALTANAVVGQAEVFLKNGFNDFLSKPIDAHKMDAILNKWIRDKHVQDRLVQDKHVQEHLQNQKSRPIVLDPAAGLPEISGIDIKRGAGMIGGSLKVYREILSTFCQDLEERLPLLQSAPNESNLNDFTTLVHGIKSGAASVAAADASARAAELEEAGHAGNLTQIENQLPAFIALLAELAKNIKAALGSSPGN